MNLSDALKSFDDATDIPEVQAVERLHLQPGDTIVLKFKERLSLEAIQRIRETVERHLGKGVPVMVLESGADIQVLRQE